MLRARPNLRWLLSSDVSRYTDASTCMWESAQPSQRTACEQVGARLPHIWLRCRETQAVLSTRARPQLGCLVPSSCLIRSTRVGFGARAALFDCCICEIY